MTSLSIIVPAFNEEGGIGSVLKDITRAFDSCHIPYEIIVIDDGSADKTGEVAAQYNVKVISNPCNVGYGASLKRGILSARYDCIAICDADGTYPASMLPRMVGYIEQGFDMVIGTRPGKYSHSSMMRNPIRFFFHQMVNFVIGSKVQDPNSGFRIFLKDKAVPLLTHLSPGISFTTSMTIYMILSGHFIKFIPIEYYPRKGTTKVKGIRDTLRTAQLLFETIMFYNPIKAILPFSIIFFILSIVPFISYVLKGDALSGFSSLVLFTAGIQTFILGLMASLISRRR